MKYSLFILLSLLVGCGTTKQRSQVGSKPVNPLVKIIGSPTFPLEMETVDDAHEEPKTNFNFIKWNF